MQSIAEVIIKNTSNANERQDFWEKAELNLLMALMHYVATQTIPGTTELLPIQQRSLGGHLPDALQRVLWGSGAAL